MSGDRTLGCGFKMLGLLEVVLETLQLGLPAALP